MDFPDRITIVQNSISIRPRYAETDRAGVIHHSVYPVWFEMGRTELLRANGVAYTDLEEQGIIFVVAELHIKYRRPAFYDQTLQLDTTCTRVTASRAEHAYAVKNQATGMLLTEGASTLACVDGDGKIRRMPEFMHMGTE